MPGLTLFNKSDKYFSFQSCSALAAYQQWEWAGRDHESDVISRFRLHLQVVLIPPHFPTDPPVTLKGLEWQHLPQKQTWGGRRKHRECKCTGNARSNLGVPRPGSLWQLHGSWPSTETLPSHVLHHCSSGTAWPLSVQRFISSAIKFYQKEKEAAADYCKLCFWHVEKLFPYIKLAKLPLSLSSQKTTELI